MKTSSIERQGHATLDLRSREAKGQKIARVLDMPALPGRRLLEVGTGAGGIAHYFAVRHMPPFMVDAVDVRDCRQVSDGYRFHKVDGTSLPFDNDTFDVVVTNHVIEHVGDRAAQLHHLREIRRVMRPEGKVYLAVPNRWMIVEPHYRIAFLSWLPSRWRTAYLRARGRGEVYDCEPLRRFEVESLAREAGFFARNTSIDALRALVSIETDASLAARAVAKLPDAILRPLDRIIPTHVYILERSH